MITSATLATNMQYCFKLIHSFAIATNTATNNPGKKRMRRCHLNAFGRYSINATPLHTAATMTDIHHARRNNVGFTRARID